MHSSSFQNKIFYITPGVIPSQACLKEMIEHAGGSVDRQRRTLKEILDLNAGVNPLSHFPNSMNSIQSPMSGIPFHPPVSNAYSSPQTSVTPSHPSLTNGPSTGPTLPNHAGVPSGTAVNAGADSETANKPVATPVQNSSATNVPVTPTPNGNAAVTNKDEPMDIDSELKKDIKQEIVETDTKKENTVELKQDAKKQDDTIESEERVLMKPPVPVPAFGPVQSFRPKAPERPNQDKKEPVYLVISVLNDLHLVKDLMKAKIGKFYVLC